MNVSRLGVIELKEVKYVDPGVDDRRLLPGDVLFNNTNSAALVGKTALFQGSGEFAFSNHMTRVRADPEIVPAFLAAQLHYLWMSGELIHLITNHVNQASISTQVLARRVNLAIPPIQEQERIVVAIAEHVSRLDAADGYVDAAETKRDGLTSQVLRGYLEQDGNWQEVELREVAQLSLGKMLDAKQQTGGSPAQYLRNINVRWGRFDLSDLAIMDVWPKERERCTIRRGDLVMCEGGEPGRCAVWSEEEPMVIQKALHRIRPHESASSGFLALVFLQMAKDGALATHFTGTTIKHLPKEKLAQIRFRLPPIDVQRRAVEAAKDFLGTCDRVMDSCALARRRSEILRQSVLLAAFSGQLVPQDPNDESASVLLARIRAKRMAATPTKRKLKAS